MSEKAFGKVIIRLLINSDKIIIYKKNDSTANPVLF